MTRQIGIIGTGARIVIGALLAGSVVYGQVVHGPFRPLSWLIGLVILPAVLLVLQWARARRDPARLEASGLMASAINVIIVFGVLLWTPSSLSFLGDAVLLFYSVSMWLAAIRGYAGCEVLAISNWLLHRNDQLGCLFFSPIDYIDRKILPRTTADHQAR